MVKKRRNINLPELECNRTGTGNKFNLIMRITVYQEASWSCYAYHIHYTSFVVIMASFLFAECDVASSALVIGKWLAFDSLFGFMWNPASLLSCTNMLLVSDYLLVCRELTIGNMHVIRIVKFRRCWVRQITLSITYCPSHVPVQTNFRRYFCYISLNQAQTRINHLKAFDEHWSTISIGFDNRWIISP